MSRDEQILREMAEALGDADQARVLHAQLSVLDEPAPAPATQALARLKRHLDVPRWFAPALVVVGFVTATAGPLNKQGLAAFEHAAWLGLCALALVAAAFVARAPKIVLAGASAAALLPALVPAAPGASDFAHCAGFELMSAVLPVAFAAFASYRSRAVSPWHLAASAACGASAGAAALAVLCPGHPTHPELILAHASGVWMATVVGFVVAAPRLALDRRAGRNLEVL